MSEVITLDRVPNQQFTVRLAGRRYSIALRDVGGVMAVDVTRDDVPVVLGMRAVAGTPLLPYRYLEAGHGNFMFISTAAGMIPRWEDFGVTTHLIYTPADELEAVRRAPA